jgi:small-conductance mechanosensitive channel
LSRNPIETGLHGPFFFLVEAFFQELMHEAVRLAPRIGTGLVVIVLFWVVTLAVRQFIGRISEKTDFNTRFVLRLAGRMASIAIMVFGVVTGLGTMGINVSALVAGLGLTGFALGFALKDVLSNFIAGVLILLYRPFHLYDHITVAGLEGTVTEIDLRYTTLQQEGQKYLIPNSILFTNSIGIIETRAQEKPDARVAL